MAAIDVHVHALTPTGLNSGLDLPCCACCQACHRGQLSVPGCIQHQYATFVTLGSFRHAQMDRTAIRSAIYARKFYILDNLECDTQSLVQAKGRICKRTSSSCQGIGLYRAESPQVWTECVLLPFRKLSLKQLRKLISSEDFKLPDKALDEEKDFFKAVVDEVCEGQVELTFTPDAACAGTPPIDMCLSLQLIASSPTAASPEPPRTKKLKTSADNQQPQKHKGSKLRAATSAPAASTAGMPQDRRLCLKFALQAVHHRSGQRDAACAMQARSTAAGWRP